jgi:hypothetical protein
MLSAVLPDNSSDQPGATALEQLDEGVPARWGAALSCGKWLQESSRFEVGQHSPYLPSCCHRT